MHDNVVQPQSQSMLECAETLSVWTIRKSINQLISLIW